MTWDGDTTDKVSDSTGMFYKVSDSTPDVSELQEINIVLSNGSISQGNADSIGEASGKYWYYESAVICIFEAGSNVQGMVFPETGLYFLIYSGMYVSELEYTLNNVKRISRDYLPSTPKFVVDATNLPTDATAWGELSTALYDSYNSGHDIFLDVEGTGSTDLKLTNNNGSYYLFLEPFNTFTIYAYILDVYSDGGELKKYSLTATEVS